MFTFPCLRARVGIRGDDEHPIHRRRVGARVGGIPNRVPRPPLQRRERADARQYVPAAKRGRAQAVRHPSPGDIRRELRRHVRSRSALVPRERKWRLHRLPRSSRQDVRADGAARRRPEPRPSDRAVLPEPGRSVLRPLGSGSGLPRHMLAQPGRVQQGLPGRRGGAGVLRLRREVRRGRGKVRARVPAKVTGTSRVAQPTSGRVSISIFIPGRVTAGRIHGESKGNERPRTFRPDAG